MDLRYAGQNQLQDKEQERHASSPTILCSCSISGRISGLTRRDNVAVLSISVQRNGGFKCCSAVIIHLILDFVSSFNFQCQVLLSDARKLFFFFFNVIRCFHLTGV